jgi:ankyrin repeat protein
MVFNKDEYSHMPLHMAAANGYNDVAALLLANKADAMPLTS